MSINLQKIQFYKLITQTGLSCFRNDWDYLLQSFCKKIINLSLTFKSNLIDNSF